MPSDLNGSMSLTANDNYMHPNPMFDLLSGWMPHSLKTLFVWCEYMYFNSAHIAVASAKKASYVVTDVSITSDSDGTSKKYKDIAGKHIRLKATMVEICSNRDVYGNAFVSVHSPVMRTIFCKECQLSVKLHDAQDFKYDHKSRVVKCSCGACGAKLTNKIDDLPEMESKDFRDLNVVLWDPKYIEIEANRITGERKYWYDIPPETRSKIMAGDPMHVARMPLGFLRAVSDRMMFEFNSDSIYHLRAPTLAGLDQTWGYPPLASGLKTFYNIAVLTRANEAIALDHLIPFRIVSPLQTGNTVDPAAMLNMGKWSEKIQRGYLEQRNDPLHIIFAPMGVNVSQINGQGRALLTLAEVEARENQLLAIMGIPREFMYGSLQTQASPIGLRMFENETESAAVDVRLCAQWIVDRVADILGDDHVEVSLTPFKFVDDVAQKMNRAQIGQALGIISKTTLAQDNSLDIDEERERIIQDAVDDARMQAEMALRVEDINNDFAQQARAAAAQGLEAGAQPGLNYDAQAILASADQLAQQFAQLDPSQRRSQTDALQSEDPVMYAVVTMRLRQLNTDSENQAIAQAQGQGQAM